MSLVTDRFVLLFFSTTMFKTDSKYKLMTDRY